MLSGTALRWVDNTEYLGFGLTRKFVRSATPCSIGVRSDRLADATTTAAHLAPLLRGGDTVPPRLAILIWRAKVEPAILYGTECDHTSLDASAADRLQRTVLKRAFGLYRRTPSWFLHAEMALPRLSTLAKQRYLRAILRSLTSPFAILSHALRRCLTECMRPGPPGVSHLRLPLVLSFLQLVDELDASDTHNIHPLTAPDRDWTPIRQLLARLLELADVSAPLPRVGIAVFMAAAAAAPVAVAAVPAADAAAPVVALVPLPPAAAVAAAAAAAAADPALAALGAGAHTMRHMAVTRAAIDKAIDRLERRWWLAEAAAKATRLQPSPLSFARELGSYHHYLSVFAAPLPFKHTMLFRLDAFNPIDEEPGDIAPACWLCGRPDSDRPSHLLSNCGTHPHRIASIAVILKLARARTTLEEAFRARTHLDFDHNDPSHVRFLARGLIAREAAPARAVLARIDIEAIPLLVNAYSSLYRLRTAARHRRLLPPPAPPAPAAAIAPHP
jgi:hypothetical protein